jgi:hypothetical protein
MEHWQHSEQTYDTIPFLSEHYAVWSIFLFPIKEIKSSSLKNLKFNKDKYWCVSLSAQFLKHVAMSLLSYLSVKHCQYEYKMRNTNEGTVSTDKLLF